MAGCEFSFLSYFVSTLMFEKFKYKKKKLELLLFIGLLAVILDDLKMLQIAPWFLVTNPAPRRQMLLKGPTFFFIMHKYIE